MPSKVIVSLSGGMDSATVLAFAKQQLGEDEVIAFGFYYGSKHGRHETEQARKFARQYGVEYNNVSLTTAFSPVKSSLLNYDQEIPQGHYESESMKQTVVPGRNAVFISLLAGYAESLGASRVYLGIHAGDHHIYPDCRPKFFHYINMAVQESTESKVSLCAPFLGRTKQEILEWGIPNKVPYELTRTCYTDDPVACGKCGSCQERLEAFAALGVPDPLEYASRELLPKSA